MMNHKTSIVFTGDIGFDKHMAGKWEDDNLLSPAVLDFLRSADHVCANVEGALIEVDETVPRAVCFHAMNPKATTVLQKMQADLWSIGNNHTMDAGADGVESTQKIAKDLGCRVFGGGMNIDDASTPVYLKEAGGIGLICLSYMNGCHPATDTEPGIFRWDDFALISKRIKEIKAKCRWCVIVCHGGEEFTALATPYTRDRYWKFLEMGADVVVGHHPHVAENYELFDNGKAIFYSLGNFIFDTDYQRAHPYTDVGILLKLIFTENKMSFEAVGIKINRGSEHIDITPLPDIFTNIPASEYKLLAPLAAKGFIIDEKRKMIYLNPEKYKNCEQAVWDDHILNGKLEEYTKGCHMDGNYLNALAIKSEEGAWKQSRLEKVKQYILNQLLGDKLMKKATIVFTGDIGFDKYMEGKWADEKLFSQPVLDFFHNADHVCANVEGALFETDPTVPRDVCFHAMNPGAAKALEKIGAKIWSIGNNHIMDAGVDGIISTKMIADQQGCNTFGAGLNLEDASRPFYIEEAGGIGMIGVTYMNDCVPATETEPGIFRWDDMCTIAKRISEIKAKNRWCVIVAHGGEEFAAMPIPYTRDRYIKYLELGADVVVGHHPHVPENYELFDNGKIIFYSLGNFVFDTDYQRAHKYTENGILLKLIFTEENLTFEAVGIQIIRGTEQIDLAPLPDIFTNISAEEFELLAPLSAKAFVEEEKRKMIYLKPGKFDNYTKDDWENYLATRISSSYYKDGHQDFGYILPYANTSEDGHWQESKLDKVKQYILAQL